MGKTNLVTVSLLGNNSQGVEPIDKQFYNKSLAGNYGREVIRFNPDFVKIPSLINFIREQGYFFLPVESDVPGGTHCYMLAPFNDVHLTLYEISPRVEVKFLSRRGKNEEDGIVKKLNTFLGNK